MTDEQGERAREEAWAMAALMVGAGLLGTVAGLLLDSRLGTRPWGLLVGALVGLAAGLFLVIRAGLNFARREARHR